MHFWTCAERFTIFEILVHHYVRTTQYWVMPLLVVIVLFIVYNVSSILFPIVKHGKY